MDLHEKVIGKFAPYRYEAALEFQNCFASLPDKALAWSDLFRLTNDRYGYVRQEAIEALGEAIPFAPDKNQVWKGLCQLLSDNDPIIRGRTADAIGSAFSYMPNPYAAWDKLKILALDADRYVRWKTAHAIGKSFRDLPDKAQAWNMLIELTADSDGIVQEFSSRGLSFASAFSKEMQDVIDIQRDLHKLSHHQSNFVRMYAYYCLGRISISHAIDAENEADFRKELERGLDFFEKAYDQPIFSQPICTNPARFCLPFYRSFYVITFKNNEALKEAESFLSAAKRATEGSRSKEILLRAVENLSHALLEVRNIQITNLDIVKGDLRIYKQYCEHAADLLAYSERDAPVATRIILRGLPIIDKKIRIIISEIKDNARDFCISARNTPFQEISEGTFELTNRLDTLKYKESARNILIDLIIYLRPMCMFLPESSKPIICDQLDNIENSDIHAISLALKNTLIALNILLSNQEEQIGFLKGILDSRLRIIDYNIFRIKITSGNIAANLLAMKKEVDEIKSIKNSINVLGSGFQNFENSLDHCMLITHSDIDRLVDQMRELIIDRPQTAETKDILDLIEQMKKSKKDKLFDRIVDLSSIIGLILSILQFSISGS